MEVLQGFVNPHAPLCNPPECLGQIVDLRITCHGAATQWRDSARMMKLQSGNVRAMGIEDDFNKLIMSLATRSRSNLLLVWFVFHPELVSFCQVSAWSLSVFFLGSLAQSPPARSTTARKASTATTRTNKQTPNTTKHQALNTNNTQQTTRNKQHTRSSNTQQVATRNKQLPISNNHQITQ